jgi:ribonucleoside-triphosphate reductase
LVKKIAQHLSSTLFTITPTFSICPKHGYISEKHFLLSQSCDEENGYVATTYKSEGQNELALKN